MIAFKELKSFIGLKLSKSLSLKIKINLYYLVLRIKMLKAQT